MHPQAQISGKIFEHLPQLSQPSLAPSDSLRGKTDSNQVSPPPPGIFPGELSRVALILFFGEGVFCFSNEIASPMEKKTSKIEVLLPILSPTELIAASGWGGFHRGDRRTKRLTHPFRHFHCPDTYQSLPLLSPF